MSSRNKILDKLENATLADLKLMDNRQLMMATIIVFSEMLGHVREINLKTRQHLKLSDTQETMKKDA